jgi:pyruvate/2-oxoglutarate dehydrogenase complex dihydrolipoamide dehydrogenase (E3) component
MWDSIRDGLVSLAEQYGVNPLVFAVIYVGTIPLYTASIGWVVRRLLRGRSYLLPGALAGLFYLSSYLYVFAVGRNLPLWVYGLMLVMISGGAYFTIQNIRKRTGMSPDDCTHDLIVLGGGAAGVAAARLGARFGAKTLLIEQGHLGATAEEGTPQLGGDATWEGCIPSKTLLKSAKAVHQQRHASKYGLPDGGEPDVDFAAVMEHVRAVRQQAFDEAGHPRHLAALGAEVRAGRARFLDPHTVEIEQSDGVHTASARYIIIAAGGAPDPPPIEGLDRTPHLTSASLFEISRRPEHLLVIGAGPIGTEMTQAFQRLGSTVTVVDHADRILAKDDPEPAAMLRGVLEEEGVRYHFDATVERVGEHGPEENDAEDGDESSSTGSVFADIQTADGEEKRLEADALLVATGRGAALEALHLDAADVEHTERGITVSSRCRTSQRHIYAAGDVTGRYQFTHMSEHMAKVAATNALLKIPIKVDTHHVPWVTYTDPELAHVGATEAGLNEEGTDYEVHRFPYDRLDRALCEGERTGLVKVYATRWRGKILGATILGARAGELICEYAVAMKHGVTLRNLADTVHPYPSYGLGARRAADQWYASMRSPKVADWIKSIFDYKGEVPDLDSNGDGTDAETADEDAAGEDATDDDGRE